MITTDFMILIKQKTQTRLQPIEWKDAKRADHQRPEAALLVTRLSEFIAKDIEGIIQEWENFAGTLLAQDQENTMGKLRDYARIMLLEFAANINEPQTEPEERSKAESNSDSTGDKSAGAEAHGRDRQEAGFSMNATVSEFRALRASVIRRWQKSLIGKPLSGTEINEMIRFNEAVDQATMQSVVSFINEKDKQTLLLNSVLSLIPDLTFTFNTDGRLTNANQATAGFFKRPAAQMVGQTFTDIDPTNGAALQAQLEFVILTKNQWQGDMPYPNPAGSSEVYEYLIIPIIDRDGNLASVLATAHNVTARKSREEDAWREATHDPLTGLANRRMFLDCLERDVTRCERSGSGIALLFIDLDKFKETNDQFGHNAGDVLLQLVADRLRSSVRKADILARLGGDEFCVILQDLINTEPAERVAETIRVQLSEPFNVMNNPIQISGSIGIAFFPRDANTSKELMAKVDQAMYAAKQAGKNQFRFARPAGTEQADQSSGV